jgi:hypothetical protein
MLEQSDGEPDYRTVTKAVFSFWLGESKPVTLSIQDQSGKDIWAIEIKGHKGINQYRWDLVIRKETSDYPYFVHYDKFIEAGNYVVTVSSNENQLKQPFVVSKGTSPYLK